MSTIQPQRLEQLIDEAELRKLAVNYAIATDALGSGQADQIAFGRELYRDTFTSDAKVNAGDSDVLTGPDAWADFVMEALAVYTSTQHLVGTIDVKLDEPGDGKQTNTATMTTYLHATHEHNPEGDLWIVLGTYHDELQRTPQGWRISRRTLSITSSEMRKHG